MAQVKISELPSASSLTGSEVLPVVQGGSTLGATVNQIKDKIQASTINVLKMNASSVQTLANIGELAFNPDTQTLEVKCSADVTLSIGQENYIRGKNAESSTILNGTVVYVSGGQGANSLIKRAGNADGTAERVIGVATQDIGANNIGFITTSGIVNKFNTSAYTDGNLLWLGTNGAMTNVKPNTTVDQICIGVVLRAHATQGSILVAVKDDWRDKLAEVRSDLNEINDKVEQVKDGGLEDGSIELPKLSPTLAAYIGSGGEVTNQADDDDLENTIINGVPVIRDKTTKTYNPENYSGMGRVILRKNMINGVNVLTQEMINQANTIYEIKYDFDLNGQEITIPEGCVLDFQGGSIDDGTINCNSTTIVDKFSGNATIVGTYSFQDAQADEEDITQNQSSVLKFKDRKYEPDKYSGLGRVILRKNIVEIDDPIYGKVTKNILFHNMIAQSNTIYEIRYDYDLNGATLTIPTGCILQFEGGSLSNGVINGTYSKVVGNTTDILNKVKLIGSWRNLTCELSWWFCKAGVGIDNSANIQYAFDSEIPIIEVAERYYISSPISLPYNKVIKGRTGNNNMITGFSANDNFASKMVTLPDRDGVASYTVEIFGMFYHRDTTKLELHDIYIDARYKSQFCIEHIDLYGSCDLYNCYIANATKVGVLQYACEMPVFDQVYITGCHLGLFISNRKLDKDNVLNLDGSHKGMCNLVNMNMVRALSCNYGMILNGGSNFTLNNCETAYNSVFGILLSSSTFNVDNFYVEGDGMCNFWIHSDGIKEKTENVGIALPYLIENNLDGFMNHSGEDKLYGDNVKWRAPIILKNANVRIDSAFLSVKARSVQIVDVTTIDNPNVSTSGGVDSFFVITNPSKLTANNITQYALTGDIGIPCLYTLVELSYTADARRSRVTLDMNNHYMQKTTIYVSYPCAFGSTDDIIGSKGVDRYDHYYNVISTREFLDFNLDIESKRYGSSRNVDYRQNEFVKTYKNIPLFKKTLTGANAIMYFTKDEFNVFNRGYKQLKVVCFAEVLEDTTCRIQLDGRFTLNESFVTNFIALDQGGTREYKKGVYRYEQICTSSTFLEYDRASIDFSTGETIPGTVLLSDIYFYEVEDGIMKMPNYSSFYLKSGTTSERPILNVSNIGFQYYDSTLNKMILWNGTAWVNMDGTALI